jgi:hypothetical protein
MFYLFEAGTSGIYALSTDLTGANMERLECFPWLLRTALTAKQLDLHFAGAAPTLKERGYCVLDTAEARRVA